jgi:apolipoprotein N-acyltransferase
VSAAHRLRAAALAIVLAWGWRRALIATAAGAVSALAMAPFHAFPLLFLTFPVMVWLIDGAAAGRLGGLPAAAIAGWWFGFGYFVAGLYWVGYAFLVDADLFGWLLPVAVTGLPALLALFTAAGFALGRLLWAPGPSRVLTLAAALTASEWLRGHLFTGFPWNAFGYAFSEPLALAQAASLVGLWGLTFLAVAIFAAPATLLDAPVPGASPARRLWAPALALVALAAMAGFGTLRLGQFAVPPVKDVKLRIMQPNVKQDVKFNYGAKAEVMAKYLALSDRATSPTTSGVKDATVLIWPESAFPFFLTREADAMAQIAALLPPGTTLVTGAVRPPDGPRNARIVRAYNSIYAIGDDGSVLGIYDKLHLVPFGEYLPFQQWMERLGFQQLTMLRGGYIPGTTRKLMEVPRAPPMLPLICYEAVFPGAVVPEGERPGWIVNVTNDGWFGISTGPYQHLDQTRMRAIEEGLPVVRAANTGISAVIDPLGRITASLPLGVEGVLDAQLPSALPAPPFTRLRDFPVALLIAAAVVIALRVRARHRSR